MFQKMRDSEAKQASACPQCPAVLCGHCSQGRQAVFHGEGGIGSPPAREYPEHLRAPNGCEAARNGATSWESAERPGPLPCPYSVMPGAEQPCKAAGLEASGLDHSSALCVWKTPLGAGSSISVCLGLLGSWQDSDCVLQTAHSGTVTRLHLAELTSLALFWVAG